ncbi:MAG: hypothetical protein QM535_08910 [Limnohabitans sp.]|nr:hypothetical protein [Limnohabitans sp.]
MAISNTAIEAYGVKDIWNNHKYIEAVVSAKGLAFKLKKRPFFEKATIKMEINRPFCIITPMGKNPNISGVLDGNFVRLIDKTGKTISERENPKSYFPYGRRLFYWDDLDMAYFACYAFWNYLTFPKLLMNEQIEWLEKEPGKLIAKFLAHIPTHSKKQEFYFDSSTGLLQQYNYTAEVISGFADAANIVTEHSINSDNIRFASKRRVTPQNFKGKPLQSPVLIDLTIHNFELLNDLYFYETYK